MSFFLNNIDYIYSFIFYLIFGVILLLLIYIFNCEKYDKLLKKNNYTTFLCSLIIAFSFNIYFFINHGDSENQDNSLYGYTLGDKVSEYVLVNKFSEDIYYKESEDGYIFYHEKSLDNPKVSVLLGFSKSNITSEITVDSDYMYSYNYPDYNIDIEYMYSYNYPDYNIDNIHLNFEFSNNNLASKFYDKAYNKLLKKYKTKSFLFSYDFSNNYSKIRIDIENEKNVIIKLERKHNEDILKKEFDEIYNNDNNRKDNIIQKI